MGLELALDQPVWEPGELCHQPGQGERENGGGDESTQGEAEPMARAAPSGSPAAMARAERAARAAVGHAHDRRIGDRDGRELKAEVEQRMEADQGGRRNSQAGIEGVHAPPAQAMRTYIGEPANRPDQCHRGRNTKLKCVLEVSVVGVVPEGVRSAALVATVDLGEGAVAGTEPRRVADRAHDPLIGGKPRLALDALPREAIGQIVATEREHRGAQGQGDEAGDQHVALAHQPGRAEARHQHRKARGRARDAGPRTRQNQGEGQSDHGPDQPPAAPGDPHQPDPPRQLLSSPAAQVPVDGRDQQAERAQQAEPGVGRIGITVDEAAGEAPHPGPLVPPEHHPEIEDKDDQAIGGIGDPGHHQRLNDPVGAARLPAELKREPEHPGIGQEQHGRGAGGVGIGRDAAAGLGAQHARRLDPERMMPAARRERQDLERGDQHREAEPGDRRPQPVRRDHAMRRPQGCGPTPSE